MELLHSLLLGFVQGLTEWLPVSSTFHMALFRPFVTLEVFENTADNEMFWELFKVFIRLGAILAVCFLYKNKLNYFNVKKKKRRAPLKSNQNGNKI